MSLSTKLRRAPGRIVTGAFIIDQGITKLTSQDDDTAKHLHGAAKGAYPMVEQVQPRAFMKTLGVAEVALGSALLLPIVPAAVAGAGLVAFSGALLTMWWRTPGMHEEGSPRPTQQGTPIAKDSWMLGIGAGLLLDDIFEGRSERARRKAGEKVEQAKAEAAGKIEQAKAEAGQAKAEAGRIKAEAKRMKAEAKAAAKGRQVDLAKTVGELSGVARGFKGEAEAKGRELLATGKQRGAEAALTASRMNRKQRKNARKQARAAAAELRRSSAELAKRTTKAAQDTAKAAQGAVKDVGDAARGAVESLTS